MQFVGVQIADDAVFGVYPSFAALAQSLRADLANACPMNVNAANFDLKFGLVRRPDGTYALPIDLRASAITPEPDLVDWLLDTDGRLRTVDDLLNADILDLTDPTVRQLDWTHYGLMD